MILPALLTLLQDVPATGAPSETPPSGPASPWSSGLMQFAPLIPIFAIFYFVLIGPERKNRKKREAMLAAMKKGDKVMTSGGMFGTIVALQDKVVTLQLDEGVRVRFTRQAIQELVGDEPSTDSSKH